MYFGPNGVFTKFKQGNFSEAKRVFIVYPNNDSKGFWEDRESNTKQLGSEISLLVNLGEFTCTAWKTFISDLENKFGTIVNRDNTFHKVHKVHNYELIPPHNESNAPRIFSLDSLASTSSYLFKEAMMNLLKFGILITSCTLKTLFLFMIVIFWILSKFLIYFAILLNRLAALLKKLALLLNKLTIWIGNLLKTVDMKNIERISRNFLDKINYKGAIFLCTCIFFVFIIKVINFI